MAMQWDILPVRGTDRTHEAPDPLRDQTNQRRVGVVS